MKTKEDILVDNNYFTGAFQVTPDKTKKKILSAMEEYAQQQACEFIRWREDNWIYSAIDEAFSPKNYTIDYKEFSLEQLYNQFLHREEKQI